MKGGYRKPRTWAEGKAAGLVMLRCTSHRGRLRAGQLLRRDLHWFWTMRDGGRFFPVTVAELTKIRAAKYPPIHGVTRAREQGDDAYQRCLNLGIDVVAYDHATIVELQACTSRGRAWFAEHLAHATPAGLDRVAVEARYAGPILDGLDADGLTVEGVPLGD